MNSVGSFKAEKQKEEEKNGTTNAEKEQGSMRCSRKQVDCERKHFYNIIDLLRAFDDIDSISTKRISSIPN